MSEYTQIKTSDLERIRLAITAVSDVLELYPSKVDPISTSDRDQKLADKVCLWCFKAIGKSRPSRGCHEYCVKKAISQTSEDVLMKLNRLMPAGKGGRPSDRLATKVEPAKSDAVNLKAKRNNGN
jgi:hypothetical protein